MHLAFPWRFNAPSTMSGMRFAGVIVIFGIVTVLADRAQMAEASSGCQNYFSHCTTADECLDVWVGLGCNAGTPVCSGQYVCGTHENCDMDPEQPIAIWCMVEEVQ